MFVAPWPCSRSFATDVQGNTTHLITGRGDHSHVVRVFGQATGVLSRHAPLYGHVPVDAPCLGKERMSRPWNAKRTPISKGARNCQHHASSMNTCNVGNSRRVTRRSSSVLVLRGGKIALLIAQTSHQVVQHRLAPTTPPIRRTHSPFQPMHT